MKAIFDNRNTNAKNGLTYWIDIIGLIRHSKRCKQSRTLRVGDIKKLVSYVLSGNMTHIRKFCNDEDIELLNK